MEPIQTLMMMLHWKSIFNCITMKLTFLLPYVPRIFRTCVKTFLFSFISLFLLHWHGGNFFCVRLFSSSFRMPFFPSSFKMRHMPLFLLVEKDLYALRDESDFIELWIPVRFLLLYYHIFVSWIDSFLRFDFYLQLGLNRSRDKVVSTNKKKEEKI